MDDTHDDGPPRTAGKPVDPRLLRYASASRGFFVAIGAIALAQTAVIVAFAWLLTRAITGAIDGMPLPGLAPTLGALAAVVALRSVLLWAREAVAARAAARVQTQLRTALIAAIGVLGPEWLGARNSAALAVTAGRGLDALEAYFGRYLPQLVQTVVATPLIVAVMWWQDWVSGLTVLLTLPLIPIFMVLIGLATRSVQQRQWRTLQHLASRFADTVQGLSTLKVFGRQHRAAASIERVTGEYRRETMRVLRVSFLSGFALEFLASISVAIVAVSIGFRLIDGSLALSVGLFVLLLAPEAYLPLRQVGVQFHAAAEGVAATDDVFDVLDAARTARPTVSPVAEAGRTDSP
ncbi:MAG: ABC transporter transmembrane domain-containing protein, partial [Actinomycetota bacterium]|nr:ABC transporter transmembrane domain-containing protein [Actinomycetota bacterium]